MKLALAVTALFLVSFSAHAANFEWSMSRAGGIFCYPAYADGVVRPNEAPVSMAYCGFQWAATNRGGTACFPAFRSGRLVPGALSVDESFCLRR